MWVFAELSVHGFLFLGALFGAYRFRDWLKQKSRNSKVDQLVRGLETKFVVIALIWIGSAVTAGVVSVVLRFL
jgi:hypothetical protein